MDANLTHASPADPALSMVDQGVALARQGQVEAAAALFRRAIDIRPEHAPAHHNLGVALAQQGAPHEAVRSLIEALRLQPTYIDAHYNLGIIYDQLKRPLEAIASYRRALDLRPDYPEALNNLGLALVNQGTFGAAKVLLKQALRLRPNFLEATNNLGLALTEAGAFREAEECFEQALRLDPRHAEAHTNLGNNYKEFGQPEEALACYDLAVTLQPAAVTPHWNRAIVLLQMGDYERGWAEYEWRRRKPDSGIQAFPQPFWTGADFRGQTILLHAEQGLGDALQFVRYAPLVKAYGGRVVLAVPEVMRTLVGRTAGVDQVVSEKGTVPPFDVQAPLLSLPALLSTTLATIPAEVPYLVADLELVKEWQARWESTAGFKVGICWKGNPRHRKDRERSLPLGRFEGLAQVAGVCLISLQKGAGTEQLADSHFPVMVPADVPAASAGTFDETAAQIKNLDLVITIDTAVAHLAGGLGVPVWILLPKSADWRWLRERADSPWYPTARLFRQKTWGDWDTVFASIGTELDRRVRRK